VGQRRDLISRADVVQRERPVRIGEPRPPPQPQRAAPGRRPDGFSPAPALAAALWASRATVRGRRSGGRTAESRLAGGGPDQPRIRHRQRPQLGLGAGGVGEARGAGLVGAAALTWAVSAGGWRPTSEDQDVEALTQVTEQSVLWQRLVEAKGSSAAAFHFRCPPASGRSEPERPAARPTGTTTGAGAAPPARGRVAVVRRPVGPAKAGRVSSPDQRQPPVHARAVAVQPMKERAAVRESPAGWAGGRWGRQFADTVTPTTQCPESARAA